MEKIGRTTLIETKTVIITAKEWPLFVVVTAMVSGRIALVVVAGFGMPGGVAVVIPGVLVVGVGVGTVPVTFI